MQFFCLAAIAAFATTAASVPTTSSSCSSGKQLTAAHETVNFDKLTPTLVGAVSPGVTTGGLFFQSYNVFQASLLGVVQLAGVAAHSPPNIIATGAITQTTGGQPMITTNFANSNTTVFDLNSMYVGCALAADSSAVALPQACNIAFTGYQGSDNTVANAKQVCAFTVNYNPSTNLGVQQPAFTGQFPSSCKGLNFVTIQYAIMPASENALQSRLTMSIDDVDATIYYCK